MASDCTCTAHCMRSNPGAPKMASNALRRFSTGVAGVAGVTGGAGTGRPVGAGAGDAVGAVGMVGAVGAGFGIVAGGVFGAQAPAGQHEAEQERRGQVGEADPAEAGHARATGVT